MDGNSWKVATEGASGSRPSEAWLVAQQLLGKPIPNPAAAAAEARRQREQLEWLAQISTRHEAELRRLRSEEAEARRNREQLEWLAQISTRHERELRNLRRAEADARQAAARSQAFLESLGVQEAEWDPAKHPRGAFTQNPGWFSPTGGAGTTAIAATNSGPIRNAFGRAGQSTPHIPLVSAPVSPPRPVTVSRELEPPDAYLLAPAEQGSDANHVTTQWPNGVTERGAQPRMVKLALAWHRTNEALQQTRRDIETLPAKIAKERSMHGRGGHYAYLHDRSVATARADLKRAREAVPQLEKQLADLKKQYHDEGYDDVEYSTWTGGETIASGRGIEDVGWAVSRSSSPAGLRPTNVELGVAMGAPSVLALGRVALRKVLTNGAASIPELPAFSAGGKTSAVFRSPKGESSLVSGRAGPASLLAKPTPGFNAITSTHVEGHAAAMMRQQGISEATIYINNPRICLPCQQNLANMLPPTSKLTVVLPDGTFKTFIGNAK